VVKYIEITFGGDDHKPPVAVEPYVSPTPTRLFVPLTEHPELCPNPEIVAIQRAGVESQPPTRGQGKFVCGGREGPIGHSSWLLGDIMRQEQEARRNYRGVAPLPARRARRRASHGQHPGHRRVRSARAGPDDEPPSPPRHRHARYGLIDRRRLLLDSAGVA
jgi:hypothetical protein